MATATPERLSGLGPIGDLVTIAEQDALSHCSRPARSGITTFATARTTTTAVRMSSQNGCATDAALDTSLGSGCQRLAASHPLGAHLHQLPQLPAWQSNRSQGAHQAGPRRRRGGWPNDLKPQPAPADPRAFLAEKAVSLGSALHVPAARFQLGLTERSQQRQGRAALGPTTPPTTAPQQAERCSRQF